MKQPEYFRCYYESLEIIRNLTDEQAGKLYKAKYEYMETHVSPKFDDPSLKIIWNYEKAKMDRDFKGLYISRVTGLYGSYCKRTPKDQQLSKYDWVMWQKNRPLKDELPDPAFDFVEPEDFIEKQKGSSAMNYDDYDP